MECESNDFPLDWHDGLLYLNEKNVDKIQGRQIGNELRARFKGLPRVGFLREPYVMVNVDGDQLLSLQALCVLCGNSYEFKSNEAQADIYQIIFETLRDIIVSNKAYRDLAVPDRPCRPFPPLPRRLPL